jgi:hypothetical protein
MREHMTWPRAFMIVGCAWAAAFAISQCSFSMKMVDPNKPQEAAEPAVIPAPRNYKAGEMQL